MMESGPYLALISIRCLAVKSSASSQLTRSSSAPLRRRIIGCRMRGVRILVSLMKSYPLMPLRHSSPSLVTPLRPSAPTTRPFSTRRLSLQPAPQYGHTAICFSMVFPLLNERVHGGVHHGLVRLCGNAAAFESHILQIVLIDETQAVGRACPHAPRAFGLVGAQIAFDDLRDRLVRENQIADITGSRRETTSHAPYGHAMTQLRQPMQRSMLTATRSPS